LEQSLRATQRLRQGFLQTGYPADVMLDVVFSAIEPKVEGNDASGYRVTLQYPQKKSIFYVVKEQEKYKVLDSSEKPNSLGLEILDRLAAGNLEGARTLLDWIREEEHLAGGDDPLDGMAFPRMWTKGKDASLEQMRLAAAAILSQSKETSPQAISILEQGMSSENSETGKLNIQIALLSAYSYSENYEKLRATADQLLKQYPESKRVFLDEENALCGLQRFQDADSLAQERLKRIPGDLDAMRGLVKAAMEKEDYVLAHKRARDIVDAGKAEASDLNALAWLALFTDKVSDSDVEDAVKAARLSQNASTSILHTLGCVYAEVGKTKEAREVLTQAMDQLALDEPNEAYWYAFGRIAEQYGERDIAVSDYSRVTKPKKLNQIPDSSYRLAQNRLQLLQNTHNDAKSAKP
jgi:tetratricopeptide (TPR) repeat protein